jgi:hypothetical protein
MSHNSVNSQIDLLEERLGVLAATVIDGRAEMLQAASAGLQLLAVDLLQMLDAKELEQLRAPQCSRRIRSLATGLALVRENLLRQAAYVDRALELVMPSSQQKSTYPGSRTYGAPVRQSGAFNVLAA